MCCGVNMGETEKAVPVEPSSKSARKRRMEIHQFNFVTSYSTVVPPLGMKRQKIEVVVEEKPKGNELARVPDGGEKKMSTPSGGLLPEFPKFGMTSVCGRRRDMEDSVAIHPSFLLRDYDFPSGFHFFGVYDGHGCSHVRNIALTLIRYVKILISQLFFELKIYFYFPNWILGFDQVQGKDARNSES